MKLSLTPEEMKDMGSKVIDLLVEHFQSLPSKPVSRKATRSEMENSFRENAPAAGRHWKEVLGRIEQHVMTNIMYTTHPRFFAFISSPSNFVSVMADALISGLNAFAGTWFEASAAAEIELVTIDWLRQRCGLPESAGGLFVSGGSMANLTALAVARKIQLDDKLQEATVYFSDQTHSSVERALRILGFQQDQMVRIESGENFRLSPKVLLQKIQSDRQSGRKPFCVIANAGSTNTGSIDPLLELHDVCRRENVWLHVDGAYGASAVFSERGKLLLKGISNVDSLALDPHKWLFQPYECGCVLVRDAQLLEKTFHILPEYLLDLKPGPDEVNFCDYGIQLTRSFRALKLWLFFQVFGTEEIARAIERGFELAEIAERKLRERQNWLIITPAHMGIVTFRYEVEGMKEEDKSQVCKAIVQKIAAESFAFLSTTVLNGKTVLRMCTINPRTTDEDVSDTIASLDRHARSLLL